MWSAARLGILWGLGHTLTIGTIVGMVLITALLADPCMGLASDALSLAFGLFLATRSASSVAVCRTAELDSTMRSGPGGR
jgi:hypothetical protein